MANDRLRELTPIPVDFYSGERPTDEKLEGMMTQVDDAFDQVENILGDLFGDTGIDPLWTTNIGRDLGDRSSLNPVVLPDVMVDGYNQQLTLGKNEHELDMIPVGSGSSMLLASTDSSVDITKFKNTEELLLEPGDWTIRPGKLEAGVTKNSRKLVTHSPSSGGVITFATVTSGKGSTYHGSRLNVIPSVAQAIAGGPFLDVVLSNASDNIYTITLPLHEVEYDSVGDSSPTSSSNMQPSLAGSQRAELPSYFFDAAGLDLLSDDQNGAAKLIPLNTIQLWDWDAKKAIEGIEELKCSPNVASRKYQFTVKIRPDILLDTSAGRYMISTSGTSVYEMLGAIQRELIFHDHDGDDQVRHIKHKSLMGLRTGSANTGDRSKWYGPSSIDANDHSMYFHRDGFTASDKGAGGNVIRGDVVVGSKTTGPDSQHENYNLSDDSNAVAFGKEVDGGRIYFDKVRTHNLPEGRGNIPQNYSDTSVVVEGAKNDANSAIKTATVEGNLRVTKDVVLGTTKDDDVLVAGDLYVYQSTTLTPKTDAEIAAIAGETGKMAYSISQNAPVFWNGSAWINPASAGYSAVVGDGVSSFGRFNGATSAATQAAVAYVESIGGGKILMLRGSYNFAATPVTMNNKVQVDGEGVVTSVAATGTAFILATGSNGCQVKNLKIVAPIGVDMSGSNHALADLDLLGCANGWVQRVGANNNKFSSLKITNYLNESTARNNVEVATKPVGYMVNSFVIDPVNKAGSVSKFKRTSGSGSIAYEDSTDTAMGYGRFAITGTGTWVVDALIPIDPLLGVGGSVSHKASVAGGAFTAGVQCYDAALTLLGSNGGCLSNAAPSTTSWALKYSYARSELNSGANNLKIGTRFVKAYIEVTSNPGTIYFDNFNLVPMNFAALALYY